MFPNCSYWLECVLIEIYTPVFLEASLASYTKCSIHMLFTRKSFFSWIYRDSRARLAIPEQLLPYSAL